MSCKGIALEILGGSKNEIVSHLSFSEDDFSKNQKSVSIANFYNIRSTMADFSYSFVLSIYTHLISALLYGLHFDKGFGE